MIFGSAKNFQEKFPQLVENCKIRILKAARFFILPLPA